MSKKTNHPTKPKQPAHSLFALKFFWGAVIFALAFLIYSNTFNHGFVFDDLTQIQQNGLVQKGSKAIPELLSTSYRHGYDQQNSGLYRPLSNVMFALEFDKAGLKPRLYHISNVFIYALICLFLFLALSKLFSNYHPAWAVVATILFTVHPVHTEVVANIKSRDELLNSLGLVLSIWSLALYIRSGKWVYILAALLAYTFSLFSKESAISFLAIFPLVLYFFSDFGLKKILTISALFLIPASIFLILMFSLLKSLETDHYIDIIQNSLMACKGFGERSATTMVLLGNYIRLLFIPYPLISDYSYNYIPVVNWFDWKPIATLLLLLAAFVFTFKYIAQKNIYVFGFLFACVAISMVCNVFITISWTFGERFLFIPSMGFCIAIGYFLFAVFKIENKPQSPSPIKNKAFVGVLSVVILLFSIQTYGRNEEWSSNLTLFAADVVKAPENARLHALYAKCLDDQAVETSSSIAADQAEKEYRQAIAIYSYRDFHNGLGTILNLKRNFSEARDCFKAAIAIADSIPDYWHNLGIAYQGLSKLDSATIAYQTALNYSPYYIKSIINLSGVYNERKMYKEAIEMCRRAINLNPMQKELYTNMCIYHRDMGNKDSAIFYYNLGK